MIKKLFTRNNEGRLIDEKISEAIKKGDTEEWEMLMDIRHDENRRQDVEWFKGFGGAVVSAAGGIVMGIGLVVVEEVVRHKLGK